MESLLELESLSPEIAEEFLCDRAFRAQLRAFARSRFGIAEADAEDLVQETALELLRYDRRVRQPHAFLMTVFRARCARFLARRQTHPTEPLDPDLDLPTRPAGGDRMIALRQALRTISSPCQRILCAHYMEGESLRETARRFSLKHKSISKTVSRCLRQLRAFLA
jgi:RNA polymerase sigma factor (sigma-70 family)